MRRDPAGDAPAPAARLAALDGRIDQLADPTALLALATEIDALGVELAAELRRFAAEPERIAPLRPVLARVPNVHARAALRAAELFDDAGSPRRAAYVLLETLRMVFDPDTIATVVTALLFTLDAHGQAPAAARLRELVTANAEPGASRREVRARFLAGLDALRAAIDWPALEDELGLD